MEVRRLKLLFKQKFFSWFDSYDIFSESGDTLYTVKGELAWGHQMRIYDAMGNDVGCVREKILTWLPRFDIFLGDRHAGSIQKAFTLLRPRFDIDFNGWQVEGDWLEWEYRILDASGHAIAHVSKEIWNWTDTYTIDVNNPEDALCALMLVLAIDAEKCSRSD